MQNIPDGNSVNPGVINIYQRIPEKYTWDPKSSFVSVRMPGFTHDHQPILVYMDGPA